MLKTTRRIVHVCLLWTVVVLLSFDTAFACFGRRARRIMFYQRVVVTTSPSDVEADNNAGGAAAGDAPTEGAGEAEGEQAHQKRNVGAEGEA